MTAHKGLEAVREALGRYDCPNIVGAQRECPTFLSETSWCPICVVSAALSGLAAEIAELERLREDAARLDWLEAEMEQERQALAVGLTPARSLFRRNECITRAAIDEARGALRPESTEEPRHD